VGPQSVAPDAELKETIEAFDQAFAEGRLDEFSAFFADDAQLLIHQQETVIAKEKIRASFGQVFDGFDTSAYEPRYEIIDVHGNRAYVLASFDEVLRPRNGHPGILIHGRAVQFWRRESDGAWRLVRLLTARSAPEEPESQGPTRLVP
jgi:ketosteroid isomerase-like protein